MLVSGRAGHLQTLQRREFKFKICGGYDKGHLQAKGGKPDSRSRSPRKGGQAGGEGQQAKKW